MQSTNEARFSKKVCSWTACEGFALFTDDLIIEILTWLPAKCLTRYKSVCKLWCVIIKSRKFIEKHMQHAKPSIRFINSLNSPPSKKPFKFCFTLDGLILERNILNESHGMINESHGYCRIRNPATNWNLVLPVQQVFSKYRFMIWMSMIYLPSSEKYKVLSVQADFVDIYLNVLTVGVDVTWRHVEVPVFCRHNRGIVRSMTCDGVSYIMRYCRKYELPHIFACQIKDECLVEIPLPQRVVSLCGTGSLFRLTECYNKFGLWCMLKGDFHIWILQDHTKAEWDERKIVLPPSVFKQYPFIESSRPYKVTSTEVFMSTGDPSQYLCYYFESKKVLWGYKSVTLATSLVSLF
ncbi:hypothetical protein LIER_43198 [Lithospermum erythrorhizon]|uniref:F-box domain-containing protein n=1 Tax=Lithospermum erythrorhizon TaxID=34254 RepID=A0AAV3PNY3_LITER